MAIVTRVHLPLPPSVNRIWRASRAGKHKVSRSAQYRAWIKRADALALATAALRGVPTINGRFVALITLALDPVIAADVAREPPFDLDNRIKGVLDWAQSRRLIGNDRRCMELTVRWGAPGEAPYGCKLTLSEVSS